MLTQRFPSALMAHKRVGGPFPVSLPKPQKPRYLIDPVAFVIAVIGAPLLVALLTFWILLIPVFAIVYGGIPYLVIGVPVLLYYIPRYEVSVGKIAGLAFACFAVGLFVLVGFLFLAGLHKELYILMFFAAFGAIFAPAWGATFAWIYLRQQSDFYKHARL